MPYTAPTLAEAQTALSQRLQDPDQVRWEPDELTSYLTEALRWWNAMTAFWRDSGSFATLGPSPFPIPFYDLATMLPTLRPRSVTNWELVTDIQYALIEPPTPAGWTGTQQFDLTVITAAIERRRAQFQKETGQVLTYTEGVDGVPAANGRIDLDEAVLLVRRATWRTTLTTLLQPLQRSDEWAADHYQPRWPAAGVDETPYSYSVTAVPPITLQLFPPPVVSGRVDLVTLNRGATINPVVSASLDVCDDWAWVIKFGVLADLLGQDGLAFDPARAEYCQARWTQGVIMAAKAPVVLTARIDDQVVNINALTDLDNYQVLWQLVAGAPIEVGFAGQNLFMTVPPAGSNTYTITLDVVRNAPVPDPGVPGDPLQIGPDSYDSLLDYAQHLALFKEGAGQLTLAKGLYERAARGAGVDLSVQQAAQPARRPIVRQQTQEEAINARQDEPLPAE